MDDNDASSKEKLYKPLLIASWLRVPKSVDTVSPVAFVTVPTNTQRSEDCQCEANDGNFTASNEITADFKIVDLVISFLYPYRIVSILKYDKP